MFFQIKDYQVRYRPAVDQSSTSNSPSLTMTSHALLAYIGPELMLPFLSLLATIAGGILIGWRWIARRFSTLFRRKHEEEKPAEKSGGATDRDSATM